MTPTIYHGTPLSPRAALEQMAGRSFCVSFYRPDDLEVVERIASTVMFRQWGIFTLEGCCKSRQGMGGSERLGQLLRMARATFAGRSMGSNTRQPRRTIADKRRDAERLAFCPMGRSALAHGQFHRSALAPLRQIRACLLGLDRFGQGLSGWLRSMVSPHGRGCQRIGQSMARYSHDARRDGCARVSFHQCRQHQPSAERAFI